MSECNCRDCVEAGALEMIRQDGWRMAKTVHHGDGTVCMAGVWEQSAKLLQARAEAAEEMVADLWELIPPQEPSPEFTAKVQALIARSEKKQTDDRSS